MLFVLGSRPMYPSFFRETRRPETVGFCGGRESQNQGRARGGQGRELEMGCLDCGGDSNECNPVEWTEAVAHDGGTESGRKGLEELVVSCGGAY